MKIIKVIDGYAFQLLYAYLSNIKYEGVTYKSAEHLYTAKYAKHHNCLDIIQDILEAEDGYAAKRLIRNYLKLKD